MSSRQSTPSRPAVAVAVVATLGVTLAMLGGCHRVSAPDRANFTAALNTYLAQRGHFCLAKYDWPIVVTETQFQAGGRNALQLPILEKLGLVRHEDVTANVKGDDGRMQKLEGHRFALTAQGRKYYLHIPVVVQSNAVNRVVHPADLCAATLTLNRLVGWEPLRTYEGRTRTSVTYTYRIEPVPWARTREAQLAFPMLKRVIDGAGTLQLREGFTLTPKGWVADELID